MRKFLFVVVFAATVVGAALLTADRCEAQGDVTVEMTDQYGGTVAPEHQAFADTVFATVQHLAYRMLPSNWVVYIYFNDLVSEGYAAETEADTDYYIAYIGFDIESLFPRDRCIVLDTVVHEVIHILTWELASIAYNVYEDDDVMWDVIQRIDEQTTTNLTTAFLPPACQ